MQKASEYLRFLNKTYFKLHKTYEDFFWLSYMGNHKVDKKMNKALNARDLFRSNKEYSEKAKALITNASVEEKTKLNLWLRFFSFYQTPEEALPIKRKIDVLESIIHKKRAERKEGYINPYTKKFTPTSSVQMRTMISTDPDEKIRKACFDAREKMATGVLKEYIQIVKLRNSYAKTLGYSDFYDFKVQREDGMTKKELFSIFDSIYKKTKYANKNIVNLAKKIPGLRKPWNFGFMMSGDFRKEEDQYFQFDDALLRWGQSFNALGIDYRQGRLSLDLLSRKGKYNNGFCHWPDMVRFEKGKRFPGSTNFTCNVVVGQVGSGEEGYNTLFHEGGHAAHLLNSMQTESCVNHEYSPMSTSWAETQSMFLDTVFSSVEWNSRYSKNSKGEPYPFDLFERMARKLHVVRPLDLYNIIFVANYEKEIYESKNLNENMVLNIARRNFRKYFERSEDSLLALNVPHIYAWESSASYHGYGLAELALAQWREYFYKKYGYIVDNPNVGKEMTAVWQLAGSKSFSEFVFLATGKKLSADSYLKNVTMSLPTLIKNAKNKIARLRKVKTQNKAVKLNADIRMVHGNKEIANNKKSFEDMAIKYGKWLKTQAIKS